VFEKVNRFKDKEFFKKINNDFTENVSVTHKQQPINFRGCRIIRKIWCCHQYFFILRVVALKLFGLAAHEKSLRFGRGTIPSNI
jgi:hypothetical protein